MSANPLDIVQFKVMGKLFQQNILNVFHYRVVVNDEPNNYERLCQYFRAHFLIRWKDIVSNQYSAHLITCENLTNGIDIFQYPNGFVGDNSGDCMPPYVTWSFRLNRTTRLTRHGQKRFAGVPEAQVSNGLAVSGMTFALTDMANLLASDIVLDVDPPGNPNLILRPVIVGTKIVAGKRVKDLTKINNVLSAQFVSVGTQNTRKFNS